MPPKTTCPISRTKFRSGAKAAPVTINGRAMLATPREFTTGSLGWNINEKLPVEVDGVVVMCQVGLNLTIIGSKDAPQA